ncbi:PREDICTED: DNA polymerase epsilon subunit 2 [Propithecus coquereli]|uniref:DNA polymerase epsilon subunit 2 n=1 Tax=Propithecus coquereli TaxID=379532 RepID=UPI00063F45CD|nr:PREDICTED: DNA polymerase epsilon subunit 2 [Propithecus coquereli]
MAPERVRSRALSAFKLRGLLLRGFPLWPGAVAHALSSNMIERSVVEAAVQECSQSVDETMFWEEFQCERRLIGVCGFSLGINDSLSERSDKWGRKREQHRSSGNHGSWGLTGCAEEIRKTSYAQHQQVRQIRKKMMEIMTREVQTNDLKEVVNKLIPDSIGKDIEKACQSIYPLHDVFVRKRSHRHELFTPPVIGCHPDESRSKFQLKTIETLLGSTTKIGDVIILGMITQLKEGKFFLEDPTGTVQLDLSKAQFHSGLYTEACFVLAEGWFEDQVFHQEIKQSCFVNDTPFCTRAYYGNTNFFGGPSNTSVKISAKLKQLEEENKDAMFVFISDVWLDQVEVLEKLHTMFSDSLKTLADIICQYPDIHQSSRFVFVPGPEDPGFGSILPRPPLAESIANEFRQRVPFSVFTTNPCRIQYCTQEIIVFREDLVNKMCRNCVRFPSSNLAIPNHFVKTILSQGHLTPLPLYVCPVYWAYDYALRVYPVPDLLVIADKYDPFTVTNTECLCINPGSFPRSGFSFKVFYPSNKTVEDSKLQGF